METREKAVVCNLSIVFLLGVVGWWWPERFQLNWALSSCGELQTAHIVRLVVGISQKNFWTSFRSVCSSHFPLMGCCVNNHLDNDSKLTPLQKIYHIARVKAPRLVQGKTFPHLWLSNKDEHRRIFVRTRTNYVIKKSWRKFLVRRQRGRPLELLITRF